MAALRQRRNCRARVFRREFRRLNYLDTGQSWPYLSYCLWSLRSFRKSPAHAVVSSMESAGLIVLWPGIFTGRFPSVVLVGLCRKAIRTARIGATTFRLHTVAGIRTRKLRAFRGQSLGDVMVDRRDSDLARATVSE